MTFSHTGPGHLNSARVTFRLARKSSLTSSLPVSLRIMHTGTALHSLCHFAASIKKDSFEQRCRRLSHERQGQACAEAGWGGRSWTALGSPHCPGSGPHAHSSGECHPLAPVSRVRRRPWKAELQDSCVPLSMGVPSLTSRGLASRLPLPAVCPVMCSPSQGAFK